MATISTKPTIKVKLTAGGLVPTSSQVTLKNAVAENKLSALNDVDSTAKSDGFVPVYDAISDKYVIQELSAGSISGLSLDFTGVDDSTVIAYTSNVYVSKPISGDTGQVTITSNATNIVVGLASSGASNGTYGNATSVPVLTVDQYGRITDVYQQPVVVPSVSSYQYSAANNTFTIQTADAQSFSATISQVNSLSVAANLVVGNTITSSAFAANDVTTTTTSVSNTLLVVGPATLHSHLYVNGNITASDLTLSGNLTVNGTVTYINTTNLNVGDNIITLNADLPSGANPIESSGIEVNRGLQSNVHFVWDESANGWSTNTHTLHVGLLNATGLNVNGGSVFANAIIAGPNTFVVNSATSFVGIRTGAPTAPLTIGGGGATLTTPLLQITDNQDSYIQVALQNLNAGPYSSGDFVVTADTGTDLSGYIDMGKASSNYNYPDFSFVGPLDGYLLNTDGNLNIAQGTDGEIRFFANGTTTSDLIVTFKADAANTVHVLGTLTANAIIGNLDGSNVTSGTISNARLNVSNTTAAGIVQLIDSISDTSITLAATANSVKTVSDLVVSVGSTVYANATAYADTKSGQAYTNAVSFATTIAATAYSNATSFATGVADAAYTNSVSFATTIAGTAYSNAVSVAAADATSKAATAYSNAISISSADATSKTATAYSNATSYADTIAATAYSNAISTASADATSKAATAYSNASSYTDASSGVAYSNAVSFATSAVSTAYSNAVSYASTVAATAYSNAVLVSATAYSNAVTFASNASNISTGTLSGSRVESASITTPGVVQLVDSVTNTSITIAATANSAKTAYDAAIASGSTAYSNAIAFSANASNISSGTLNTDRLPATANVSTAINVGANVNLTTTSISVGNSTVNAVIGAAQSTFTSNVGIGITSPSEKLDVDGNIRHTGLVPTTGTNIDQIYTAEDNITISTSWQDTTVNASELATGSYIVQITVNDSAVGGGHVSTYYTGVMSWYGSDTDETSSDEIAMHRAGSASGAGTLFLRVLRTATGDTSDLKLQIAGTTVNSGPATYAYKFRRLI